jgi:aspartyl-tRNA(Asn)/glutamyl-tRNA(Gln) amidotransferase subunit A
MPHLHELTASELLAAYAAKTLSPVEVTRDVLAHIAAWEPQLHATYALNPEAALAQAEASQARWLKGQPCGPLDGVPTTIKENIATQGVPMPIGTAASLLTPALLDAPPAARLREAGAVILGKTTMPDYGMLSSGLSSFHPLTRNPWDLRKTPVAAALAQPPQPPQATARCTLAPTSVARCACPQAGAASLRSSPAWAASPSIRRMPDAWPGR